MNAEIGIDPDGAPFLTLGRMTETEHTLLAFFRERLGIVVGPDGMYRIRGTVPPPTPTSPGDRSA